MIACALLLLPAGATAVHAQDSSSAPFTIVTDRYEIVAPSGEALREAQQDLDFAVAQWRRYFGTDPVKIAVHVSDQPTSVVLAGTDGYRERDIPLLPWLSTRAMAALQQAGSAAPSSRALAHEACHMFLIGYVQQRRGLPVTGARRSAAAASHYGHPDVPDWFDEAVATLCEPTPLQATRTDRMLELATEALPFAELFSMLHPLSGAGRQGPGVPAGTTLAHGGGSVVMTVTSSSSSIPPEVWDRAVLFYSQALSVSRFFAQEEGDLIIGRIADAFAAGEPLDRALAGASKLTADYDALSQRWQEWLRGGGR